MVKKRLSKKWINRYLQPLVKNLPTTDGCGWGTNPSFTDNSEWVMGYNYTLINGYISPQGTRMSDRCYHGHILTHIKRTAAMIKGILDTHQQVHLRSLPTVEHKFYDYENNRRKMEYVRMRLIVEKEGVHLV